MATELRTVRTIKIANTEGDDIRTLEVLTDSLGEYWLHDPTADPNADSLEELAEDSDINVMDLIGPSGFDLLD